MENSNKTKKLEKIINILDDFSDSGIIIAHPDKVVTKEKKKNNMNCCWRHID